MNCNRIRVSCALIVACGLMAGARSANAQAPPELERIGVQLHRDYLRLQPFELLDTQSGNVILTIPMLSLSGNAGRTLDFRLTYNANIMTVGVAPWTFGIAGIPMRVDEQATPDPSPDLPITVAETWGITPLVHMPDGGKHRTMFMADPRTSTRLAITSSFWIYDRDENKLYLPDGTVYTYADDPDRRLTEIRDVYDNTVTLTWGPNALVVTQDLGNDQSRQIEFDLNTAGLPTFMRFDGNTWQYHYENGNDEDLTRTTPPHGPGWTFGYDVPMAPFRRLTSVTTPHGGQIAYEYNPHEVSPNVYYVLLDWRRTTDRGSSMPDEWHIEYALDPSGFSPETTVTTPTNRQITYQYEPAQIANPDINPSLLIDGSIALRRTTTKGLVEGNWEEFESDARKYSQLAALWWLNSTTHFDGLVPWQRTVSRVGQPQPYTTTLAYGNDSPLNAFADYHQPNRITESGELSRTITRSYFHGATPYVRGQIAGETVEAGGESWTRTWSYETATGFKTRQTEFGSTANDGIPTTFTRDDRGNVRTITSATQKTTTFDYSWGQVSATYTPEFTTSRSINLNGTVASETSAGRTTQFTYEPYYDGFRLKQTQPPGGTNPIAIDYDGGTSIRTSRGATVETAMVETTTVDGFGRPIQVDKNSIGVTIRTNYDPEGRVVHEGYPFTGTAELHAVLEYDPLHRITRRTNPDDTSSTRSYGAGTVTLTDEEGRTTVQTWGAFGDPDEAMLLTVRDARNQTWSYAYYALGQLGGVIAPDLTTRTWLYNAQNRLSSETHPESGVTTYLAYDAAGHLTRKRDANDTVFDYTYDGNDRLRTITALNRVTTMSYEPGSNNRLSMSNGDGSTTFGYDAAGRVAQRQDEIGGHAFTTAYGYNGNDHVTSLTYPSGRTIDYDRDGAGRVTRIFETAAGRDYAFGMTYHASGALATYTAGNNISTTIAYDPARYWAQSITAGALQLTYGPYDAVGNVGAIGDSRLGMGYTFTYDELDRLETATGPLNVSYAYDAHGNRQTADANTYVYNPATLRLMEANGVALAYDANGNLAARGPDTFTYTADNMLGSATTLSGGSTITYAYDADNWRLRRTTQAGTTYYVRGVQGELLTEFVIPTTGTSVARDYVYAGSRLISAVEKTITPSSNDISGTILANGPSVTQSITTAGKRVLLQFSGVAGHRYRAAAWLTSGDFGCGAWLELRTAAGDLVANTSSSSGCSSLLLEAVILPTSGTYYVVLDPLGPGTGTAVARLYDIHGVISADGSLNTVTATNGEPLLLEFQSLVGQRYSVVGNNTAGTMGCTLSWLAIRTPQWTQLGGIQESWGCSLLMWSSAAVTSPMVHFVVVDPTNTNTGTANVKLYTLNDYENTITLGGAAVTASLATPGQRALLTFNGTAGQRVSALVTETSGSLGCGGKIQIQQPNGSFLPGQGTSACGGGAFQDAVDLPTTGIYTIIVDPIYDWTATVSVRGYTVPPDVTGTITPGSPQTLTITVPGQNGALTFTGTSGQRISVKGTNGSFSGHLDFGCDVWVTVRQPNGTTVSGSNTCVESSGFMDVKTLTATGTYTLVIDPATRSTGSVTLTLYDVPSDVTGTITAGSPLIVPITTPGQNGALTFSGTTGQRMSLHGTNASISGHLDFGCDVWVTIRQPNTSTLSGSMTCMEGGGFMDVKTLPATGTYTVVIDPGTAAIGNLTLTLHDVSTDVTGSLTIGGAAALVSIPAPGQIASLTFTGTASQQVTVRMTSNTMGSTTVKLLKPDGNPLTSGASAGTSFNLTTQTLPTTGTYTVIVDPSGTNTGSMNVTVTSP